MDVAEEGNRSVAQATPSGADRPTSAAPAGRYQCCNDARPASSGHKDEAG
jgi:hypothetical protein